MRRTAAILAGLLVTIGLACSSDDKPSGGPKTQVPAVTAASPELAITSFDVAEAGWGDAPVAVHFLWEIQSTTGRPLRCDFDLDGDGTIDVSRESCVTSTAAEAMESLPAHTYATPGKHVPKLVVSDGVNTVEKTQNIYANQLIYAKNTVFPEKLPGFVKADAVPNTSVVLTFADPTQVPDLQPGQILWGTSGNGYLIKVTSAARAGNAVTVTGVQGMLGEAVEDGYLGARDMQPRYEDAKCEEGDCAGSTFQVLTDPVRPPAIGTKTIGQRRDALEIKGNFGVKITLPQDENVEHSVFVGVRLKEFEIQIRRFSVSLINMDVVGGFNYELTLKLEGEKTKQLGKISLGTFAIGPVIIAPVIIPTLSLAARLKYTGSIGLDVPMHAVYTPDTGFSLDVNPTTLGIVKDIVDPIKAEVSVEAEAKLSFPLYLLLFGIAGPYFGPNIGAGASYAVGTPQATDNPCRRILEVCRGAKAFFGGEVGVGCPWVEGANKKVDIQIGEIELYKYCHGRDEENQDLCKDSGVPGDGDAGIEDAGKDAADSGQTDPDLPEINILGYADGANDSVGDKAAGVPFTRLYTIANDGTADLKIGTVTKAPSNATCSISNDPSSATVFPGNAKTLEVTVTPTAPGGFACVIGVPNNDGDESIYDLTISGNVKAPPTITGDYTGNLAVKSDPNGHNSFVWGAPKTVGFKVTQAGPTITVTPLSGFTPSTLPTMTGSLVGNDVTLTGQGTIAGFSNVKLTAPCTFTAPAISCPDWEVGSAGGTSLPNGPIHYTFSGSHP